ncbi:MAG: HigA family addiction module antidote protein [Hyphomicrobiales bacterium]|nr:HigA family addiction module antidote protein [Hyphomicrobiales bacterium]
MRTHNRSHPGEIIREDCLKPVGLTVTAAARGLGVTRKALSDLLNGHSGVSPEMAIRLEGGMEHGRYVASHADDLESLGSPSKCRQDQGPEV